MNNSKRPILRHRRGPATALLAALAMLLSLCLPALAARTPLVMEGKTSLYQRILTRPGAILCSHPDNCNGSRQIPPLSIFFVYDRRQHDGAEWLEVGAASEGPPDGWLTADKAIDWKQTLTVAFTNPEGREPALFFRRRNELAGLIRSESMVRRIDRYRNRIAAGDIPPTFPVIAAEPETYVDPRTNFYLLPILNHERIRFQSGYRGLLLNVAAVTLRDDGDPLASNRSAPPLKDSTRLLKSYRAGIVFVIDSTRSMGPYIARTREAIHRIYRRLQDSRQGDNVSFGLVTFRDSTKAVPKLDYVTWKVADLADGLSERTFFAKVNQVREAAASSEGFNEDAIAGVHDAIREINWQGFDGRFIILITDAGARAATDPYSSTRLGPERLRLLAREAEGGAIAIYTLHLLTRDGRHTHSQAAAQYRQLSQWEDDASLYFPVRFPTDEDKTDGALTAAFGKTVDKLASLLVQQIEQASQGRIVQVPTAERGNELERRTALVGRAMQLAYLGRVTGARVPPMINAWVADRDLVHETQKPLEVRVLITKNQLSDLQQTLQAILEAGTLGRIDPENFFAQLRSAAARLARDPENINEVAVRQLADVGQVGEWLEGLPYKSQFMHITQDMWLQFSHTQQQELLDAIEEKIVLYRKLHDDTDRWITLDAGRVRGDAVTSIPVDALP